MRSLTSFELGKTYIVDVTEKGIIPREEFDEDRWFDKDHDDLDFLTDEEKAVVAEKVLKYLRAKLKERTMAECSDYEVTIEMRGYNYAVTDLRILIDHEIEEMKKHE